MRSDSPAEGHYTVIDGNESKDDSASFGPASYVTNRTPDQQMPTSNNTLPQKPNIRKWLKYLLLAFPPLVSTLCDTANISFDIEDIENVPDKLASHLELTGDAFVVMRILLPVLYFVSSLTLNTHWVINGMRTGYKIFRGQTYLNEWPILTEQEIAATVYNYQLPHHWPDIKTISSEEKDDIINQLRAVKCKNDWKKSSRTKRLLLIATILSSASIDAASTYYYMYVLCNEKIDPGFDRNYFALIFTPLAVIYSLTNIFSEGIETIQTMNNREKDEYSSSCSRYTTIFFNGTSALLGSASNATEYFFPMIISFNATTPAEKSIALCWTFTKFVTDYCLGRANCREALDAFLYHFTSSDKKSCGEWFKKTIVLSAAFYSAVLLADLQRAFFIELIHNPLTETATLPFNLPNGVIETLARGRSIRDTVTNTYFLYDFFAVLFDLTAYLPKKMLAACRKKQNSYKQLPEMDNEQHAIQELMPLHLSNKQEADTIQKITVRISQSKNTLFAGSSSLKNGLIKSLDKNTEKDRLQKKCACVIM